MVFPHYWTLWDKIPHYWTLFIVDADAIVVCYPLHDDGRQSFARPHAHSAKLVLVTTKITVKRLSVNPGPIGQFLSCHCFHTSSFFWHASLTEVKATRGRAGHGWTRIFYSCNSCNSCSLKLFPWPSVSIRA